MMSNEQLMHHPPTNAESAVTDVPAAPPTAPATCRDCGDALDPDEIEEGKCTFCTEESCQHCSESLSDGEGFDGYCGNCADILDSHGYWDSRSKEGPALDALDAQSPIANLAEVHPRATTARKLLRAIADLAVSLGYQVTSSIPTETEGYAAGKTVTEIRIATLTTTEGDELR